MKIQDMHTIVVPVGDPSFRELAALKIHSNYSGSRKGTRYFRFSHEGFLNAHEDSRLEGTVIRSVKHIDPSAKE